MDALSVERIEIDTFYKWPGFEKEDSRLLNLSLLKETSLKRLFLMKMGLSVVQEMFFIKTFHLF